MQPEFWLARWQENQIGFHRTAVHEYLQRHIHRLGLHPDANVLVPLCGKSVDMGYLRAQGAGVTGVELSELAVRAFFDENRIPVRTSRSGDLMVHEGGGFRLFVGDFFALSAAQIGAVSAAYDRAALVALPEPMRQDYARHLAALMPAGSPVLLITLAYPQHEMNGPPFSVTDDEVSDLFRRAFTIEILERRDTIGQEPRLQALGVTSFVESAYLLVRR
ncbi:MAG: thiopurine S-methyltransferase [Acidiferrobacteraceae bacterium]